MDLGRGELSVDALKSALEKVSSNNNGASHHAPHVDATQMANNAILTHINQTAKTHATKQASGINVGGVTGIATYIAKCCKPLPGDLIVGFVTQGRGIAIHRGSCTDLKRQVKACPNKMIDVSWGDNMQLGAYNADIVVVANDRALLLKEITDLLISCI